MYEEQNLNKTERSCYYLKSKIDEDYIKKEELGDYFQSKSKFECDESCESCNSTETVKCTECKNGFYPLMNETNEESKNCYNELTAPKNFYLENNVYKECDTSCSSCTLTADNCSQCTTGYYTLFNETKLSTKKCYNELNKPEGYYNKNNLYYPCDISCLQCEGESNNFHQLLQKLFFF